jgi:hypothetical protein
MPLSSEDGQTYRQFLHNKQDRHQKQPQKKKPVNPLHATLRRSDDAADIRVGEHDDQPWPYDG